MGGITAALDSTERRIARFFGAESGVLFNSRAQAVLTIVTALCSEGVVVITRPLSPLPLADACSLVGAELVECESVDNLRTLLAKNVLTRRVIIALESISALTGEAVDISPWLSTAASAGAWVIVDETTGLGLNGIRGAGSAEAVPTSPALLARIVGFQHAIGHEASCVVGPVELRDLLIKRSRYLRQEPSPPSVAARLLDTAVDSIELALGAREMLAARSALVHRALKAQGWRMPAAAPSPIASLWFDTFQKAQEVQDAMLQRGILVEALPARSIRRNGAVLRALISIAHSQEELGALMSGFAEIKMRLDALKS
jgi:7-keto-8-aminopelargonate synthetase-like enzyme